METEVDFVAKDVAVEEFPDILFSLIGIETLFGGESFSDFGEFFLYSFGFGLFIFAGSNI